MGAKKGESSAEKREIIRSFLIFLEDVALLYLRYGYFDLDKKHVLEWVCKLSSTCIKIRAFWNMGKIVHLLLTRAHLFALFSDADVLMFYFWSSLR